MRILRNLAFTVAIALILELTVFNFRFYESLFFKNVDYRYKYEDGIITVYDVDAVVRNVHIDIENKKKDSAGVYKVKIYASDEGHAKEYGLPEREIYLDVKKSHYINLDLSGKCKGMTIKLTDAEGAKTDLNELEINVTRPFDFNVLRVFIVLCVTGLFLILRNAGSLRNIKADAKDKRALAVITLFATVNIMAAVLLSQLNLIFNPNIFEHHTQYQELAKAFCEGHLYLDEKPPAYLAEMDNPYDYSARESYAAKTGKDYMWDTAYFDGKYYVYFGVVPVILVYLPFLLITGKSIENSVVVGIAAIFFVLAVMWFIYSMVRRYFKRTSLLMYLAVCEGVIVSSGLWYMMKRPDFYIVPIICGVTFSLLGLSMWVSSVRKDGSINLFKMCTASLCMALVAGCRPQLVLASAAGLVIFWKVWKKKREVILFFLPYVVVAAAILWYNYMRFGSVLDFGASYNLTIDDMTHRGISLNRVFLGLYAYLIQPLSLDVRFPYIRRNTLNTYYQGVTSIENPYAGIFVANVFLTLNFALWRVKNWFKDTRIFVLTVLFAVTGILLVLVDTQLGGIYMRYTSDFLWVFALGAALTALVIYEHTYDNANYSRWFRNIVFVLLFVTVCVQGFAVFTDIDNSMKYGNVDLYYTILHTVEFWL